MYLYCQKCGEYVCGGNCVCGWEQPIDFDDQYVSREEYNSLLEMYNELKFRMDGLEK